MITKDQGKKTIIHFANRFWSSRFDELYTFDCEQGWIFILDYWLVPKYGVRYRNLNSPWVIILDKYNARVEYISNYDILKASDNGKSYSEKIKLFFDQYSSKNSVNFQIDWKSSKDFHQVLIELEKFPYSLFGKIRHLLFCWGRFR